MNGWTLAKYALALAGISLVLAADDLGRGWLGYIGLGLLLVAFALRFAQRRVEQARDGPPPPAGDG